MRAPPPPTRLWNRDFTLLWQGQLLSQAGTQLHELALGLWVVERGLSATVLGLLLFASAFPSCILGPLGGALADRHSRKRILVTCDLLFGVLGLILAIAFFTVPQATLLLLGLLFVNRIAASLINALFWPTVSAMTPDLVPRASIGRANAANLAASEGGKLGGRALAGIAYTALGMPLLMLLDGISFLASAASETFIREPERPRGTCERPPLWHDMLDGFRFVWRWRSLRAVTIVAAAFHWFLAPLMVLLPFYTQQADFLDTTPAWLGFLFAGFGAGLIGGFLLLAWGQARWPRFVSISIPAQLLTGLGIAALALIREPPLAFVALLVSGLGLGIVINAIYTTLQLSLPESVRGRALSLIGTLCTMIMPLAYAVSGLATDAIGGRIDLVFAVCGGGMIALGLGGLAVPALRGFLTGHPEAVIPPAHSTAALDRAARDPES